MGGEESDTGRLVSHKGFLPDGAWGKPTQLLGPELRWWVLAGQRD